MLAELVGKGWTIVQPPRIEDGDSVVARYQGEPIKAGFLMERVKEGEEECHFRYRTGQYDLDLKLDFELGKGQVRVQEAPGYSN